MRIERCVPNDCAIYPEEVISSIQQQQQRIKKFNKMKKKRVREISVPYIVAVALYESGKPPRFHIKFHFPIYSFASTFFGATLDFIVNVSLVRWSRRWQVWVLWIRTDFFVNALQTANVESARRCIWLNRWAMHSSEFQTVKSNQNDSFFLSLFLSLILTHTNREIHIHISTQNFLSFTIPSRNENTWNENHFVINPKLLILSCYCTICVCCIIWILYTLPAWVAESSACPPGRYYR